jgi:DNA polymerase II small subunit
VSEQARKAVGTILQAGFQMESDAFRAMVDLGGSDSLERLVKTVVQLASVTDPRPLSINRDLVLKAAESLELKSETILPETSIGRPRRFAEEIEARLDIVSDPSGKLGTTGAFDDFLHYFRNRFEKMSELFKQRLDTRTTGNISDAMSGGTNGRSRFICMVVDKREKKERITLTVDDQISEAVVLVDSHNQGLYQIARGIMRDQVIFLEVRKSSGRFLIADRIILPEIPDHKPNRARDEVYCALISDVHVGSKVFLEDEFRRVLAFLKGEARNPLEQRIADRIKYVMICGDLVDGIGVYPRQESDLLVKDIYEQYRIAAKYISEIPEHMEVVLIPGNHDAVRQALPQPAIPKEFAGPVYDARKIIALGDPAEVRLHGVHFLLYHGTSLMDIVSSVPGLDYQRPVDIMEYQLRIRHLAPEYGKATPIGPEQEDWLVVDRVPDVFQSGHIHVSGSGAYRGTSIVNSGAWQGQTDYQKRMGLEPKPGILPVVNLQTLQVHMLNFL